MSVQKEHCPDCGKEVTVSGLYYRENHKIRNEWKQTVVRLDGAWRCGACGYIHLSEDDAERFCEGVVDSDELAEPLHQDANEGKVE